MNLKIKSIKLNTYLSFSFEKFHRILCGILLLLFTGCLDFDSAKTSSKIVDNQNTGTKNEMKRNVIHNFVSYKTVDVKKELEKYSGVESVRIKSLDGSSSLFLSGSSLNSSKPVRISSNSSELELIINFQNGKELVRLLK